LTGSFWVHYTDPVRAPAILRPSAEIPDCTVRHFGSILILGFSARTLLVDDDARF